MITAIGIDIVEVKRIEKILAAYPERFVSRVLGANERATLFARRDRAQFLAGRFAAKEAIIKALGKYLVARPSYSQIEILSDGVRGPVANYDAEVARSLGRVRTLVSISHEKSHAVAMAVLAEDS